MARHVEAGDHHSAAQDPCPYLSTTAPFGCDSVTGRLLCLTRYVHTVEGGQSGFKCAFAPKPLLSYGHELALVWDPLDFRRGQLLYLYSAIDVNRKYGIGGDVESLW